MFSVIISTKTVFITASYLIYHNEARFFVILLIFELLISVQTNSWCGYTNHTLPQEQRPTCKENSLSVQKVET
jgi:hypothetical protein